MLAWPCISILFVPHVGQGGVDNICWDPQCGDISWMPNDCNHVIIFVLICAYTCLILIVLTVLLWLVCIIVPMLEFDNKLVYSMRVHWNTWGRVSQAQKRVWKRDDEVQTLCNVWDIRCGYWGYTDELWQVFCVCAVVFPLKYWSRQSWHHYMMSQGSLMW